MFTDKEKQIYKYPDGLRFGDPLRIVRHLRMVSEGKLNEYLDHYESENELEKAAAEEFIVKASRAAFNLKPLTLDGGDSDAIAIEYLFSFLEWLSKKENRGEIKLNSVQPMASLPK